MNASIRQYFAAFNTKQLLQAAIALTFGAAFIHGIVTPDHFDEWWGYGLFFLVATLLQGAYGIVLLGQIMDLDDSSEVKSSAVQSAHLIYKVGIIGNALIIVLYIITRTIGIPFFGPEAGEVEDATPLSLLSKFVEIALTVVLIMLSKHLSTTPSST